MGQSAPYQTKTATGMSILNTASQKQTASVVQSVSSILQGAIDGIYRWLLVDSDDPNLHCDAEAICTGYERFVAEEIHNQQMLQFLQIVMNVPDLAGMMKIDRFAKPMLRAFSLDPDEMLKSPEEVQQAQQAQQMAMQQKLEMEAKVKGLEAQIEQQQMKLKAALDERLSIGEQRRELEIKRVMALLENGGDPGQIGDFSELSVMLKEELLQLQQQRMMAQAQIEQQQQNERTIPAADTPVEGRTPSPMSRKAVDAPQRVFAATNVAGNGPTSPPRDPGQAIGA